MTSLSKALSLSLLLGLAPLGAQDAAPQVKAAELSKRALPLGELQVTVSRFRGQAALGYNVLGLSLRNPTQAFLPFAPEQVALVGADGNQSLLCGTFTRDAGGGVAHGSAAVHVRVAPGATLQLGYYLDHSVKTPAKLYLGDRLVAEITD